MCVFAEKVVISVLFWYNCAILEAQNTVRVNRFESGMYHNILRMNKDVPAYEEHLIHNFVLG